MQAIDQSIRDHILNQLSSMIIRAPAGSGKTHLLVARFIKCLEQCQTPDRVFAITFTKKAAEEMKHRVLSALKDNTTLPHRLRDEILSQPHLLNIFTIDGLCHQIAFSQPDISELSPDARLLSHPWPLYEIAAKRVLLRHQHSEALSTLITLNHGYVDRMLRLLTELLATRSQWIRLMARGQSDLILALEHHFHQIHQQYVDELINSFPEEHQESLLHLMNHCFEHLKCSFDATSLFHQNRHTLEAWQQVKALWLTQKNTWRQSLNKKQGLLPQHKHEKHMMMQLMNALQQEHTDWIQHLLDVDIIPCPSLSEDQSNHLSLLTGLLPQLFAELKCVFSEHEVTDFNDIAHAAQWALNQPSEVIERWVNNIDHLMIDEFQDTSQQQWDLIQTITQHWDEHDGKTLFLVGDPMQSIYLFRQADVRLFIQLFSGNHSLKALSLSQNFRANAHCVYWANTLFQKLFPNQAHLSYAAIPFHISHPIHPESERVRLFGCDSEQDEIDQVIRDIQVKSQSGSVAVLTRTRAQLNQIATRAQQANIPIHALDLSPLGEQAIVQDLLALLTITQYPADRLAWLALFRSPIFGLTLNDCQTILAQPDSIPLSLCQCDKLNISPEGKRQIHAQAPLILRRLEQPQHEPLSHWLRSLWYELNGDEGYALSKYAAKETFFNVIKEYDHLSLAPISAIKSHIQQHYFDHQHPNANVHLMTIHKSKGLEFDHVILPFLNSVDRHDGASLFLWETYYNDNDALSIMSMSQPESSHLTFIKHIKQRKRLYESQRLLYVAITRAKQTLTLMLPTQPKKGTWADAILSHNMHHDPHCLYSMANVAEEESCSNKTHFMPLTRQVSCRYLQPQPAPQPSTSMLLPSEHQYFGDWVHQCYEHLQALPSSEHLTYLQNRANQANQLFTQPSLQIKLTLWQQNISNDQNMWLFHHHDNAQNETTIHYDGQLFRVDRTFILSGVRWIIDIKTEWLATHEQSIQSLFEKHQAQMNRYAMIYESLAALPTQCVVYFPMMGLAIQWSKDGPVSWLKAPDQEYHCESER